MEREELEKPLENNEPQDTKGNLKRLIGVIIFFAAFPFLLKIGGPILGVILIPPICVAIVVMLPACMTLGLLFSGGLQIIIGAVSLTRVPVDGIKVLVMGLFLFGLGLLAILLSLKFYTKAMPWMIRKVKNGIDKMKEKNMRSK